jgi:GTP cyclohydrolase II
MQLAASNPAIHNQYEVYRNMYEALGVKDIDLILKRPEQPMPKDPALEHIDALAGKPFQAFPGQDHQAHITAHLNFMETNMVKNSPIIGAAIQKNILEHISLMAQEQIEIEFRDELPQLAQMQQAAMQNPMMQQQMRMLQERIEARKAVLVSEMMEDFKNEEKKITSQFDNDPVAALRARELDLQARENARKEKEGEERLNLDKMRAMMNDQNQDEKLKQNEELAKMRADTSIQKTILSKTIPPAKGIPDAISIVRKGE